MRLVYAYGLIAELQPHVAIWVVYLTDFRGITLAQVGLMEGFFWAVKILLEVPSGAVADRFGRRPSFALALAIEGSGVVLFGLADDYPLLLASYALWSAGLAFRSGNDQAFLYDWLAAGGEEGRYADRMGVLGALGTAAFTLGGLAGAAVAALTSLQAGVLVAGAVYAFGMPVVWLMDEPPRRAADTSPTSYAEVLRRGLRALRDRPAVRHVVLFEVLLAAAAPAHFLLAQPLLSEHGVPIALFGVLGAPVFLSNTAGHLVAGRVLRRLGIGRVLVVALLGITSGLLALAAIDHVAAFAGFALSGLVVGMLRPATSAYVNERTASEVRATVLSVGPLGISVVFALITPLLGVLGDRSLRLAFGTTAAVIVVTALPVLLLWWRADRAERDEPI